MTELQTEISELKQFIVDLKADRAETKAKEKREAWTKYVSLTVVFVAVIAAIAAQWSARYGGRVQLGQAQASDQWALYQAKSIKQHLTEAALFTLSRTANSADPDVAKQEQKMTEDIARYSKEKADVKEKAESLEKIRDDSSKRGGRMGTAVSIFTVAIATASLCTVTKKKPLWFASMIMAAVAIAEMVWAWMC